MTKEQLAAATASFQQNGGQVKVVKQGECTIDPSIRHCRCGCRGNWTDHTMRQGESGTRTGW